MLDRQSRDHRAVVDGMSQKLADAMQQIAQLKIAPAPAPVPLVTADDRQQFGEPLVDFVQRGAKDAVLPGVTQMVQQAVQPLVDRQEQLTQQVQQAEAAALQQAQNAFFARLSSARPDWEQIDEDPQWLQWLDGVEPLSGVQRQVLLDNAVKQMDLGRTKALFDAFRPTAHAPAAPAPTAPPLSGAPATVGSAPRQMSRQPDGPETVSRAEISRFYQDVALGRIKTGSAEFTAGEARINAAVAAGRVS